MIPFVTMSNFGEFLFPPAEAAGLGDVVDGLANELADRILECGRPQANEVPVPAPKRDELLDAVLNQVCRGHAMPDDLSPLARVERDPTWFIKCFDEAKNQQASRVKAARRIEREKGKLAKKIFFAVGACERGDSSPDLAADDFEQAPAPTPKPSRRFGLARWFASPAKADHAADLDELARLIDRVADSRLRSSLRREFRRSACRIWRFFADADWSPIEPVELSDSPCAPIQTAGGRTDRYVPRD